MGEYWVDYPFDFCSTSFVCWNGEPSWLGWLAMGLLVYVALATVIALFELFLVIFSR